MKAQTGPARPSPPLAGCKTRHRRAFLWCWVFHPAKTNDNAAQGRGRWVNADPDFSDQRQRWTAGGWPGGRAEAGGQHFQGGVVKSHHCRSGVHPDCWTAPAGGGEAAGLGGDQVYGQQFRGAASGTGWNRREFCSQGFIRQWISGIAFSAERNLWGPSSRDKTGYEKRTNF